MRVLLLTQFYPPESGAPQNRLSDFARRLAAAAHHVEVLTAMPNYPMGAVFDGYRRRVVLEEECDGIRVVRTWIFVSGKGGFLRRLLTYWSFVVSCFVFGLPRIRRPDAVVVELPPLFLGLSGYAISRACRAKLLLNVSDLWPESAVEMGILRRALLIRPSTRLEEFLDRRADVVTGQTQGIVQDIQSRFPNKHVRLITNGVDVRAFSAPPLPEESRKVRQEFGFAERFVIGYAGLHGHAQGLDVVLGAARLLENHGDILFAFFGEGPLKGELTASACGAKNVRFAPAQPSSRMREVLSSFDLALIPLRRLALFRGALPSKMFEAMAAGVPIVVSIEGEARTLVERSGAGACVEPENAQALTEAILAFWRDPELRRRMGENGRRYVAAHYDRALIAKQFEKLLLETVSGDPPPIVGEYGPEEDREAGGTRDKPQEESRPNPLQGAERARLISDAQAKRGHS